MGKKSQGNNYNAGNNGKIWINGLPILDCYKASIEKKPEYEEISNPNVPGGKVRVETGHTIEVSFAFKKKVENTFIDWESDDITLILTDTNNAGSLLETTEASGITFDTTVVKRFEKGTVGEIEMEGQAEEMRSLV